MIGLIGKMVRVRAAIVADAAGRLICQKCFLPLVSPSFTGPQSRVGFFSL